MDWGSIDWAVVIATFIGPIVAVIITIRYQAGSADRQVRLHTFTEMMRYRSVPLSRDFVGMLNVVPVHFNKTPRVLEAHKRLMDVYIDPTWNVLEARGALVHRTNQHIATLLAEMAKIVRVTISQSDIAQNSYAPQSWDDELMAQWTLRDLSIRALRGEQPIPVVVVHGADGTTSTA